MHKEKLIKLADFLDTLEADMFNMESVIDNFVSVDMMRRVIPCGATACAIGWCPAVFPDELQYTVFGGIRWVNGPNAYSYIGIATKLFDISFDFADSLFSAGEYDSTNDPKLVAERIRKVCE